MVFSNLLKNILH